MSERDKLKIQAAATGLVNNWSEYRRVKNTVWTSREKIKGITGKAYMITFRMTMIVKTCSV